MVVELSHFDLSGCGGLLAIGGAEDQNFLTRFLLTVGGLLLALIPGVPAIPSIGTRVRSLSSTPAISGRRIYDVAGFRANLRPILLLAIVWSWSHDGRLRSVHWLVGLPRGRFCFGAIISPPDAVAALSVHSTCGCPGKSLFILEGESLGDDATSFISFRFAVLRL